MSAESKGCSRRHCRVVDGCWVTWLKAISPFDHLALTPAEDVRWAPVLVIAVLAVAVSAAGQWLFRRRDLA